MKICWFWKKNKLELEWKDKKKSFQKFFGWVCYMLPFFFQIWTLVTYSALFYKLQIVSPVKCWWQIIYVYRKKNEKKNRLMAYKTVYFVIRFNSWWWPPQTGRLLMSLNLRNQKQFCALLTTEGEEIITRRFLNSSFFFFFFFFVCSINNIFKTKQKKSAFFFFFFLNYQL